MMQDAKYRIRHGGCSDGRRLKTIHRTAVPKTTSLGVSAQPYELSASETLSKDSTEYLGNFLYVNNYMNRYLFDGGYINGSFTSSGYKYYFRDHLGNNRLVVNPNSTVQQNTKYYPYGGHTHFSTEQGYQKYKYNGKEYDSMHGLNEYDYGARQYDPAIGMFTSIDPMCEKYYHISPYSYCGGNPVSRVDPDGDSIAVVIDSDGARGFGHMGILIQNAENSWTYYSKNGHTEKNNDGTLQTDRYETVDDFLNAHTEYDNCIVIHNGKSEEKEATQTAKETINKKYSTINANCGQFVQGILKAAKIKDGSPKYSFLYSQADAMYNQTSRIVPKIIFNNILIQNKSVHNRHIFR